eukprot:1570086-Pleurochrysis_carterae.AAC.1
MSGLKQGPSNNDIHSHVSKSLEDIGLLTTDNEEDRENQDQKEQEQEEEEEQNEEEEQEEEQRDESGEWTDDERDAMESIVRSALNSALKAVVASRNRKNREIVDATVKRAFSRS